MKTVSVKIQIPDNMELVCDEVRAVATCLRFWR